MEASQQVTPTSSSNLPQIWAAGGGAYNFKRGWNLIGGFADNPSIRSVIGNCEITRGPYTYNPVTSWNQASTLSTGQGYFIKVANDCKFGYSEPTGQTPPAPPS